MADTTNLIDIVVQDQVSAEIAPKLIAIGDAADATGVKLGTLKAQLAGMGSSGLGALTAAFRDTSAGAATLAKESGSLSSQVRATESATEKLTSAQVTGTAATARATIATVAATKAAQDNTAATLSQSEAYATARIAGGAMAGSTNMMAMGFARLASSVPLVSSLLSAAFPIIIAAAMVEVIYQVVDGLYKMIQTADNAAHSTAIAFDSIIDPLRKTNDTLAVTNDKLGVTISKLSHVPTTNGVQLAIDQARVAADRLDDSLERVSTDLDKILTKNRIGILSSILTGNATTSDTEQFIKSQFDTVDQVRKNAEQALDKASANKDPKASAAATVAAYQAERTAIQGTINALNDKWNVLNKLQDQHNHPTQTGISQYGAPQYASAPDQTANLTAVGQAVRLAQQDLRGLDETYENIGKNNAVDRLRDQTSALKDETRQAAQQWKELEASYVAFQRSITDTGHKPTAQQNLGFLVGRESTINPLNAGKLQAKEQPYRNQLANQSWKDDETSKLTDQIATIGLYSDALKEASDLNRILEQARKRNVTLSAQEIDGYKSLISQIVESSDYTKALQTIYNEINQPVDTYLGSLSALRTLYSRGQITSTQFLDGLVETTKRYDEATSAVTKYRHELTQQQHDAGNLLGSDSQNAVAKQLNTLDQGLRKPNADAQHPFGYSESEITRVNDSLRGIIAAQQKKNLVDQAANVIIQQQTNLQDRLATQNAANAIAVQHGALSQQAAGIQRTRGQAQVNQTQLANGTGGNPFVGALADMEQFKTSAQQIQDAFTPVFKTLADGFADSIGRAVVYSKNLDQALKQVAQSAVAELISALIKATEQMLIMKALGAALGMGTGGAGGFLSIGKLFGFAHGGLVYKPSLAAVAFGEQVRRPQTAYRRSCRTESTW